ncbi:hypothetical protein ACCQ08_25575 [Comamonas sp. SY3]|uniref:hypothetical protein n=1 Tax=Comamonas sp. SY3 TaxID=3243601 RepID=UPI003593260E
MQPNNFLSIHQSAEQGRIKAEALYVYIRAALDVAENKPIPKSLDAYLAQARHIWQVGSAETDNAYAALMEESHRLAQRLATHSCFIRPTGA